MQPSFEDFRAAKQNGMTDIQPEAPAVSLDNLFRPLAEFTEEEAAWIVPGWIPEGQITLIAADGGVGKTSLWVDIAAALSSGRACILDPPGYKRKPLTVLFCTTEDSVKKKLRRKLREAGADLGRIKAMDLTADKTGVLRGFKFGTMELDSVIRSIKPDLCIFDPVQGFIPADVNMGSRNAMRDCMAPLVAIGEDVGTTFVVICHTNKRKAASGRDRIADSADLWDISRSVVMLGYTSEQGERYISNEKNNYDRLQETILFSINEAGQVEKTGTTWKRDRDFQGEAAEAKTPLKVDECKAAILQTLMEQDTGLEAPALTNILQQAGFSTRTIERAKSALRQEEEIKYETTGSGRDKTKKTFVCLTY